MPKQVNAAKTAATDDGAVKPFESTLNGGDNIITISTSSITNECHSSALNEDSLKSTSSKLESANSDTAARQHSCTYLKPPATAVSVSAANVEIHTQTRSSPRCCDLSRLISFQDNNADVHHRRGRRLHGLQVPLHPLQVFGWLVLILFGIASFLVLIPSFTSEFQGPLYGLISGLYIVHVASHLAALLIDPADRELQRVHRNDRIVPEFDRNKHAHVIENGRCHLCNIRTSSPRTKHCSVCNKCVGKFDHHCKWLNHCIGSRNYVAFLMCVVSAVIATVVIVAAVVAQIMLYYVHPEWLSFWHPTAGNGASSGLSSESIANNANIDPNVVQFIQNESVLNSTIGETANVTNNFDVAANVTTNNATYLLDTDMLPDVTLPTPAANVSTLIADTINDTVLLHLNQTFTGAETTLDDAGDISKNNVTAARIAGISVSDTIFLVLIGFLGLLAAITAGLLLHLCFFHIYISFLGLTTYEYIRNHRQVQENKAKQTISNLPKEDHQHFPLTPSKKTNDCGQMYICSSTRHPNAISPADLHYFETRKPLPKREESPRSKLHCCVDSREYHQPTMKAYYMCSLLEENAPSSPLGISHISGRGNARTGGLYDSNGTPETTDSGYKTIHCCSSFGTLATQRRVSAATSKATLVSDIEAISARRSYMQYTEQCTLCTFRIRSPIVSKRVGDVNIRAVSGRHYGAQSHIELSPTQRSISASSKVVTTEHQRCCMKSISKNQRWRRKWNCCSNVPDSPDVPNDIISALTMRHQHSSATSAGKKVNATEMPVHFIKTVNGSGSGDSTTGSLSSSRPTSPRSANLKSNSRSRYSRTWPMPRLRLVMRMLGRYRRTRCRKTDGNGEVASIDEHQVKQNQIRPLHLRTSGNGAYSRHHLNHQNQQQNYNDSSSPQPPSSTTTTSERSDQSMYSDSSNLTTPSGQTPNAIETILPTSIIRDDTSMTYTTPMGITLPPALPPPTRRKIPNPTNLEELAETLSFVSHSSGGGSGTLSPVQRLPTLSNVYRRQRRKHFLRTRSPTLSPIHETGLSNPTSPQPGRHNAVASNYSAFAVTGSLGDSAEIGRKNSSNSSLHSISSNSSST
ncbi:uncharacterized protein LOC129247123 [Anastrepha obliqua]|uniref:uncharacterized protein LOC129247123 n=1 Tax=Anastrepha obliqua TaxID=95512 RepID=UPI00240A92E9|nr:uncharacterized protein LOC129247123 [Anastrepha obliqua]